MLSMHSFHLRCLWVLVLLGIQPLHQTYAQTINPAQALVAQRFFERLRLGLEQHPDVLAKKAILQAQEQAINAAIAAQYPRLDLAANAGSERATQRAKTGIEQHASGPTGRLGIALRQVIYDGNELGFVHERQLRQGNIRYFDYLRAQESYALDFARAWFDAVAAQANVQAANESLANLEALRGLLQARLAAGAARGVDLDQAQARVAQGSLNVAAEESAWQDALIRLARLERRGSIDAVRGMGLGDFSMDTAMSLPTTQSLLTQWQDQSISLAAASEAIAAALAEQKQLTAAVKPKVAIEGRHDFLGRTSTYPKSTSSSVALTMNMNLFDAGGDQRRIREAALKVEAARQQYLDEVQQVGVNGSSAWSEIERSRRSLTRAQSIVDSMRRTKDIYRVQYDNGQRSLLELLNSEGELSSALKQTTSAKNALNFQLFRVAVLSGHLRAQLMAVGADVGFQIDKLPGLFIAPALRPQGQPMLLEPVYSAAVNASEAAAPPSTVVLSQSLRLNSNDPGAKSALTVMPTTTIDAARRFVPLNAAGLGADFQAVLAQFETSLRSGKQESVQIFYAPSVIASPKWARAVDSGLRLLSVEKQSEANPSAQNQVSLLIKARGQCLRSTQRWSNLGAASAQHRWRIQQERVVELPLDRCDS